MVMVSQITTLVIFVWINDTVIKLVNVAHTDHFDDIRIHIRQHLCGFVSGFGKMIHVYAGPDAHTWSKV
jgi:hypothetical protein